MGRVRSLLAVGVMLVVAPSGGDAAVFCTKRSGAVVVRDACKAREQQMDLSQFGAVGAPGTPGAAGSTGPGVFVVDANGALVGPVIDELNIFLPPLSSRIARRLGNDVVSIPVDPAAGFPESVAPPPPPVFFASPGCTGQLFLTPPPFPPGTSMAMGVTMLIHDSVAYYALGAGATQAYASVLVFFIAPATCTGGGGTPVGSDGCCVPSAGSTTLSPAGSFDLGTLGLVPPFHAVAP